MERNLTLRLGTIVALITAAGCAKPGSKGLEKQGALIKLDPFGDPESLQFAYKPSVPENLLQLPDKLLALNFQGTPVTAEHLGHWKNLANLEELNLTGTGIGDADLIHLKQFSRLKTLHLGGTPIQGTDLNHLAELPHLETLHLGDNKLSHGTLYHLANLKRLRVLDLHNR